MGDLIRAEERPEEELALRLGKVRQERVQDAGLLAESDPPSPSPVPVLVRFRLDRIIDDSVVRSTSSTKDKISSGSGEISKRRGMSCGEEE